MACLGWMLNSYETVHRRACASRHGGLAAAGVKQARPASSNWKELRPHGTGQAGADAQQQNRSWRSCNEPGGGGGGGRCAQEPRKRQQSAAPSRTHHSRLPRSLQPGKQLGRHLWAHDARRGERGACAGCCRNPATDQPHPWAGASRGGPAPPSLLPRPLTHLSMHFQ